MLEYQTAFLCDSVSNAVRLRIHVTLKGDNFSRVHTWRKRSFVPKIIEHVECRRPMARVPESAQDATAH